MNDIETLREQIKDIRFAMLTTIEADGSLRSRPMASLNNEEFNGELWFFTSDHTPKSAEIQQERQVNLGYADPDNNRYVSVSGVASLSHDRAKMEAYWNPIMKAWFPDGLETPDIALLRVKVTKAEYWDYDQAKLVQLIGFIKAAVTGERADDVGRNEKLNIR